VKIDIVTNNISFFEGALVSLSLPSTFPTFFGCPKYSSLLFSIDDLSPYFPKQMVTFSLVTSLPTFFACPKKVAKKRHQQ